MKKKGEGDKRKGNLRGGGKKEEAGIAFIHLVVVSRCSSRQKEGGRKKGITIEKREGESLHVGQDRHPLVSFWSF